MDFGKEIDGTILSRPVIGALTRFMLGDQVADAAAALITNIETLDQLGPLSSLLSGQHHGAMTAKEQPHLSTGARL